MSMTFFALASTDLGVNSSLLNSIEGIAGLILIGIPLLFVARARAGANYQDPEYLNSQEAARAARISSSGK